MFRYTFTLIFALFFLTGPLKAQDPHFSQFYAAPLHTNPAMTGVFEGKFRVALNYRDQWSSILQDNPFRTVGASFDIRQHIAGDDYFAVGVSFLRDEAGSSRFIQNRTHLSVSYMKQLGGSRYRAFDQFLIAGGQIGLGQNRVDGNLAWFDNQFDNSIFRPNTALPTGEGDLVGDNQTTDLFLDFNAGLLYYATFDENRSFYIGGAFNHLNGPNVSFLGDSDEVLYARWLGQIGGEFPFNNNLSFLPALAATGQGPSMQTVLGGNFRYTNNDWRELAIRVGGWGRVTNKDESGTSLDAFIVSAILEVESWNFGLSYDITASSLSNANNARGAFEVSLIYVHPDSRRYKVNCPNF